MLRKLLTLLAICAGLVAVGEPARAAVVAVESVHVVARARPAYSAHSTAALTTALPATVRVAEKVKTAPKPTVVVIVPTVMLRVDRARE